MTTARTCVIADSAAMARGRSRPEGRAHGVAGLGAVEPEGGHGALVLEVRTSEENGSWGVIGPPASRHRLGESGERPAGGGHGADGGHRRGPAGPRGRDDGAPSPTEPSAGRGSNLHTFTAEGTAAWAGPTGCGRAGPRPSSVHRRRCPARAEEVWRYSPIDRLDLDAYSPGPATPADPSEAARAFALGVAADLGRAPVPLVAQRMAIRPDRRRDCPTGSPSGRALGARRPDLLGAVLGRGDALVQLNDAFSPDAIVVDVPRRRVVDAPGGDRPLVRRPRADGPPAPSRLPRTLRAVGRGRPRPSVVEVVAGADRRPAGRWSCPSPS